MWGFEWNILLFPRGNSQNNSLSIYMEPHPPVDENDKPLDENWYVCAQFGLGIQLTQMLIYQIKVIIDLLK